MALLFFRQLMPLFISAPTASIALAQPERVVVKGKFLYHNGQKLYLKGVTYGTFRPQADESQFPDL